MKLNKFFILTLLLFIIILGFNSVSASDSSDSGDSGYLLEDSSSDLSLDTVSNIDEDLSGTDLEDNTISDDVDLESSDDSKQEEASSIIDSDSLKEDSEPIYVSLSGNDDNDGSNANPVRTVERGIQLATSETGSHKVFVMEGSYDVFDMHIDYTNLTLEGSGIDKTIFDGIGFTGGMFSIYNSTFTIKNLSIIETVNTGGSGGAFTNMGNLTIENVKVTGSIVKNANGGVIYSVGNLKILNSIFRDNQVIPTDGGGNGGVIYTDGYTSNLPYPPSLNISGCEFRNNTAKGNMFGGGAIYMQYVDGFKSIENTLFIDNKALSGGAIFMQNSMGDFLMNNVSFINNTATGTVSNYGGGAINLIGKTDGRVGNVIIKNSAFINNTAIKTRGGGAILDRNVDLNITNSIIYNNKDTEKNLSVYKDTTVYYPNGGRISLEDNWWGTNNPSKLDKITIRRWVVLDSSVDLLDSIDNYINKPNSDKTLNYTVKILLNQYNDGTSIDNPLYYPFEREFMITSNGGTLNQSKGIFTNNIADVLLSSPTRENIITVTVDNQSLELYTNEIISSISGEKLQEIIDHANIGDTIDLGNCNCENVSNITINKNLNIVGNNGTAIMSYGNEVSQSGNPLFIVDESKNEVDSLNISGIKFFLDNGDTVLLVKAGNSTNPLEIDVPSINISGITVDKLNDGVVGESINVLTIDSERGLLATIPKGGNINTNDSSDNDTNPIVKLATKITAKNIKTTTVNAKINGKKAGKYFYITLKDSKGKVLAKKQLLISFNGKIYKRTTNAKGVASVKVALGKKGTYPVVISFLGDDYYNGSFAVAKVKVNPQKVKLTIAKKKYKSSKKTKVLTAKLLASNKKAIKGKKLVFIVNKKKYTAKTNKKGIAKVKVKLSKRKTYKFSVKFAGDNTFKKISKKGKVVIR